jgi:hypothetical protein
MIKYKIGDKLIPSDFDKEQYGLEYVTITSINEKNKVYHWEADFNGGKIHSGYFFHEVDNRMDFICPDPDCPHCNYEE